MRIIAGRLGGRRFSAPRGHKTHPMSDKMRGALFNALGDINGLSVLDAFAGSGAVGFEAVSRGAARVTAVDSDRQAQKTIENNIHDLGLQKEIKLVKARANSWLSTSDQQFDIVICDPPYEDPQPTLLKKLAERAKPQGVVVLSLPPKPDFDMDERYERLLVKDYGDSVLSFYRQQPRR